MEFDDKNNIIIYQDDNGVPKVNVRFADTDVWLTQQLQVATRFRRWATERLHEYIQKVFAIDDECNWLKLLQSLQCLTNHTKSLTVSWILHHSTFSLGGRCIGKYSLHKPLSRSRIKYTFPRHITYRKSPFTKVLNTESSGILHPHFSSGKSLQGGSSLMLA